MAKIKREETQARSAEEATEAVAPSDLAAATHPPPTRARAAQAQQTAVGTPLLGRTAADLTQEAEPAYSYNWPYDFFSLIELVKLDAAIEYDTD